MTKHVLGMGSGGGGEGAPQQGMSTEAFGQLMEMLVPRWDDPARNGKPLGQQFEWEQRQRADLSLPEGWEGEYYYESDFWSNPEESDDEGLAW